MFSKTQLNSNKTSHAKVFHILFFAASFIQASIQLIEYIIQFTTINKTAQSDAKNVAYLTVEDNISFNVHQFFLILQLSFWQDSINGLKSSVVFTVISAELVIEKKLNEIISNVKNFIKIFIIFW